MRDILNDAKKAAETHPEALARKHSKPALPKRFYEEADVKALEDGGFGVILDGRSVKTPARAVLAMPTEAAARLIADEFGAQEKHVDPAKMPVTRLANTAVDGVAGDRQAVVDDILQFASSDMLCYRASTPQRLVELQAEAWDPVLDLVRTNFGAHFILSEGVMHVDQPRESIDAIQTVLKSHDSPVELAAVHSMTSLTGSALLAVCVSARLIDAETAWSAAHVDEDWNIAQWGEDAEAKKLRAFRRADMDAAVRLLDAL